MGLLDGFFSLGADINKLDSSGTLEHKEGVISEDLPELELSMTDDELIQLKKDWELTWSKSNWATKLTQKQKDNEKYWSGEQDGDGIYERPLVDNLIFEATETFLPLITRQNPEPYIESENSPEGQELADKVAKMLKYQTDRLRLKQKVQSCARYWSLYYGSVMKIGWDRTQNDITLIPIRPQKLILDPDAVVEGSVYLGEYLGEYRSDRASNLIKRFPKKKAYIEKLTNGNLGTKMQYIEWWTNDYVFWTMDEEVLGKSKNIHWNYGEESIDDFGQPTQMVGKNFFPLPKMPYAFLTVFNLGLHPFDDTNIIQQNLALQDLINKRLRQIDKNADTTNNSIVVSGDFFTKDQAMQVAEALRKGNPVWAPTGKASDAIDRVVAPPLPSYIYESLLDYRAELRNIYGVQGATAQGIADEKTVRGKILTKESDVDRMSLIISHMEQFVDEIYNWMVQMMYVYYTEQHAAMIIGDENAKEYITISQQDFGPKISVSVKEGSMIPKDMLTRRNEAVDLYMAGKLDPVTAFDRMEFPDPKESAKRSVLFLNDPATYLQTYGPQLEDAPQQPIGQVPPGGEQLPDNITG